MEKFIGDAVVAVFGVPVAHEDDALRAARAAVEMREVLPELGLDGRIGVKTGEVVTGTADGSPPATRSTSGPGWSRPRRAGRGPDRPADAGAFEGAVAVEDLEPLHLKGEPQPYGRSGLVRPRGAGTARTGPHFVGRRRESSCWVTPGSARAPSGAASS